MLSGSGRPGHLGHKISRQRWRIHLDTNLWIHPASAAMNMTLFPKTCKRMIFDQALSSNKSMYFHVLPVCVLLCILRFSLRANILPQPGKGQGKGFSPVCTRIWFTSLYFALKGLPERGQDSQKQAWLLISGPPTCSMVRWETISCIEPKVLLQDLRGSGWSGSTQRQVISCFTGCRM